MNFESLLGEGRNKGCKARSCCAQKHHLVTKVSNCMDTIIKAELIKAPGIVTGSLVFTLLSVSVIVK